MRGTEPGTKGAESYTIGDEIWTVSYHHDRPRTAIEVEKSVTPDPHGDGDERLIETRVVTQAVAAQRGGSTTVCATYVVPTDDGSVTHVARLSVTKTCRSTEPYQPGVGRMLGLAEIFAEIADADNFPLADAWSRYFERHPADRRLSKYAHEIDARVPDMAPAVTRVTGVDLPAEERARLRAGRAVRRANQKAQRAGLPVELIEGASVSGECVLE